MRWINTSNHNDDDDDDDNNDNNIYEHTCMLIR